MGLEDRGRPDFDFLSLAVSDLTSGRRALATAMSVALGVVVLDQITKRWAVGRLETGPCTPETCIDVIGSLRFHLHFNPGASFSTGAGLGRLFGVIAIVMTVVLLRMAAGATDRATPILFGAIAGGAVGNLIDRLVRAEDGFLSGEVVDFIDLQWWPIFNIADAAIVVGVLSVIVVQLLMGDDEQEGEDEREGSEEGPGGAASVDTASTDTASAGSDELSS